MINDIASIIWKEWKELLVGRGLRGGLVNLLRMIGCFGVFLPLQFGRSTVESPISLVAWSWVPAFLVIQVVADAFAGERERHTLETLLASRLSDRSILLGKVAAAVSYGWGLTIFCLILALITVNLAFGDGKLVLYPADVSLRILAVTLLSGGITAALGVMISLRAASVRQVQQIMSLGWMGLIFGFGYGLRLVGSLLPKELAERIFEWLMSVGSRFSLGALLLAGGVLLALANAALLSAAMARFQRARLILD